MRWRPGIVDVLVLLGLVAATLGPLLMYVRSIRDRANRSACSASMHGLYSSLITYRDSTGALRSFPDADGSEFLLALYLREEVSEPGLFICPASGDSNGDGTLLAAGSGALPRNTCSYAGRRNANATDYPGIYTNKGASETPVISDDSEGWNTFNHGTHIVVAFLDGRTSVLAVSSRKLQGALRVGEGLLDPLAN